MKSTTQKRKEALERLKQSKWEDSKAFRTGSKTEDQWNKWKAKELARMGTK